MEICVFKVYIGNSFCRALKDDEGPPYENLILPQGYDSIYLKHPKKKELDETQQNSEKNATVD